jgi:hypothetical protein
MNQERGLTRIRRRWSTPPKTENEREEKRGSTRAMEATIGAVVMVEMRNEFQSSSVRTTTPFSPQGFPRFLSIRGARGLQAFDLALI